MAKSSDKQTDERLCRARWLVPTILVIVILHALLGKFLIYPRYIADPVNLKNEKALYGPGFGRDASLPKKSYEGSATGTEEGGIMLPEAENPERSLDGDIRQPLESVNTNEIRHEHHQFVDESELLDSEYEMPPLDFAKKTTQMMTITRKVLGSPATDERDLRILPKANDEKIFSETPAIESGDPNHERYKNHHKHRHHNKHNKTYYVATEQLKTVNLVTKPWNWSNLDLSTPISVAILTNNLHEPQVNAPFDSKGDVKTKKVTTISSPPVPLLPTTTTSMFIPTTATTISAPLITTTSHHHHHYHHHGHHQHHHHTTASILTTTVPSLPAWPITSTVRSQHRHKFPAQIQESVQIEKASQKQLQGEANLGTEEKRRMELTYQHHQQVLKHQKHQEALRLHEAEQRRRQETEARRHHQTQILIEDERHHQHKEELLKRRKLEENERKRRLEHEERLRAWKEDELRRQRFRETKPIEFALVTPVADPWAHLRHLQEQAVDSVTVSSVSRSTLILNRPGSGEAQIQGVLTNLLETAPHEVKGASVVSRKHVDPNPWRLASREHVPTHHQYHHHEGTKTKETLRETQLEREGHQRQVAKEKLFQEKHQKLLTEAEASKQTLFNEVPDTVNQNQHHHHSASGVQISHHVSHNHVPTGHYSHHHAHTHRQMTASLIPDDEITNEIAASQKKSFESRTKRDAAPTIVTALMDIGRGEWHRFTRPFDLYLNYLMDFLNLDNNVVLYGDSVVIDFVKSQGDAVNQSRLHLIEISHRDLPYYRYRDEIKSIMDSEQSAWNKTWERAVQAHPEAINPDYNILVNSKPYFLYNATQISPFPSDKFIWLDAGYSHGQKSMIPHELWNPKLEPGKITVIKITGEMDKVVNYHIDHVYRKQWTVLSGGVLAGEASIIDRFRRFFHKSFMDLLDAHKTDDDQTTLLMTVVNYNNLFNILTGGWFDAFKLLPSMP